MAGYSPTYIKAPETGLVQNRQEFILPADAYPVLQNAYVWRERIKRKLGFQLLGRLQRSIAVVHALTAGSINLISVFSLGSTASIVPGTINLVGGTDGTTYTDPNKNGTLTATGGTGTGGTINYATGLLTITAGAGQTMTGTIGYYPGLPVMGIRTRELQDSAQDQTIFFDQVYAYVFNGSTGQFQEFIPGTTWNAAGLDVTGTNFFWSTNYWTGSALLTDPPAYITAFTTNNKLFWVTNGSGASGVNADPPRITDGVKWIDFYHDTTPATNSPWAQIDAGPTYLTNWLCNLPFRGRMVTFNTWEGSSATNAKNYSNRIRWSRIGNPFIAYAAGPPAKGSWRDDIRGQGGFLDIPTSEDIVSVGFVRDNLVIYCERSTWQLRYTGRSIAPFQIERVNSELGAESTFAAIQFDTSLVSVGDKGILECDSYKAERIDIKIPDFVFQFNILNNGVSRVQGIRDFPNRLAYWTIPLVQFYGVIGNTNWIFPTARLVYNYENDSWAIFNDSLTTLGTFQLQTSPTWLQIPQTWIEYQQTWLDDDAGDPVIVGGNQQGFVEQLDQLTVNDPSLSITAISQGSTVVITSPNHNMQSGFVIGISGIPAGTPWASLNGGIYGIELGNGTGSPNDQNQFRIYTYDSALDQFVGNVTATDPGTYVGLGLINIRENFNITSKKFNFADEGQNIQMGYLDVLMPAVSEGEISLYVYLNYDDVNPSNTLYSNELVGSTPSAPDTFFNTKIPTFPSVYAVARDGSKFWQRVFCPTRANFLTLQYTFSNAQMAGNPQKKQVQIDAQILWTRKAGRITQL